MGVKPISSRRQWLAGLAAAAGVPLEARQEYNPQLSVEFYVWLQELERQKKSLADGAAEALLATARAGYHRVELSDGFYAGAVRAKTIAALKETGLAAPSVYSGGAFHETALADSSIARMLELAAVVQPLGTRMLVTNPDPKPERQAKTDRELGVQAEALNRLGAALNERGMTLLIHHHSPEMADNAREWRHILKNTDPRYCSLCIDTHWAWRGKQDPLELIREAGRRVASLHLRNSKQGVWTEEFGDGDIDYRPIAQYLHQFGFTGLLVVELAYENGTRTTRSLEQNLNVSRRYAEKIFGVKA